MEKYHKCMLREWNLVALVVKQWLISLLNIYYDKIFNEDINLFFNKFKR